MLPHRSVEKFDDNNIPFNFTLEQNYPNPFNSETTIIFQLPKALHVKIDINNIYGQKIKSLLNQNIQAGAHKLIWDGTDNFGKFVSSGIYLIYLSTQEYNKSIKSLFLKTP